MLAKGIKCAQNISVALVASNRYHNESFRKSLRDSKRPVKIRDLFILMKLKMTQFRN